MWWKRKQKPSRNDLILVKLTPEQVDQAKKVNGSRKQITHALICGSYGQIFGTKRQCMKYFTVWNPAYRIETSPGKFHSIFPNLFGKAIEVDDYDICDFSTTFDLVNVLIDAEEKLKRQT